MKIILTENMHSRNLGQNITLLCETITYLHISVGKNMLFYKASIIWNTLVVNQH